MKRIQRKLITIISVTAFCFLAGCGGGSGDSKDPEPPPPPPPTVENNWDSLVWDQGEWQ